MNILYLIDGIVIPMVFLLAITFETYYSSFILKEYHLKIR